MIYKKLKFDYKQDAIVNSTFRFFGAYKPDIEYRRGDITSFNKKYYVYINDTPTSNNNPTNETFWEEYSTTIDKEIYSKKEVDDNFVSKINLENNYYNKNESDSKFAKLSEDNVFTANQELKQNKLIRWKRDSDNEDVGVITCNDSSFWFENTKGSTVFKTVSITMDTPINISNVKDPIQNQDVATKQYVDNKVVNQIKVLESDMREWSGLTDSSKPNGYSYSKAFSQLANKKILSVVPTIQISDQKAAFSWIPTNVNGQFGISIQLFNPFGNNKPGYSFGNGEIIRIYYLD